MQVSDVKLSPLSTVTGILISKYPLALDTEEAIVIGRFDVATGEFTAATLTPAQRAAEGALFIVPELGSCNCNIFTEGDNLRITTDQGTVVAYLPTMPSNYPHPTLLTSLDGSTYSYFTSDKKFASTHLKSL